MVITTVRLDIPKYRIQYIEETWGRGRDSVVPAIGPIAIGEAGPAGPSMDQIFFSF